MFIGIVIGVLLSNWMLTAKVCGFVGLLCLGIAGLLNGLFVSGDRNRSNYDLDTKEDKIKKIRLLILYLLQDSPILLLLFLFFSNKQELV